MQQKPFQAKVPLKYLIETEDRKFWDYTIRFIDDLRANAESAATGIGDSFYFSDPYGDPPQQPDDQQEDSGGVNVENLFRAFTVPTNNFQLTDRDFARVTGGLTVLLPASPPTNAIIKVVNGDGSTITIQGNGKTINGQPDVASSSQYSVIDFYYFIDSDSWVIA